MSAFDKLLEQAVEGRNALTIRHALEREIKCVDLQALAKKYRPLAAERVPTDA
jgi:hypothetical protein